MALLLRARAPCSASHDADLRRRAAVRAVQRFPGGKVLWLLQLASLESPLDKAGALEDDEVIDL
eukprot:11216631-Heterocapsa_arctica.AAC.1